MNNVLSGMQSKLKGGFDWDKLFKRESIAARLLYFRKFY